MKFLRIYVSLHTSFAQSSFLGIFKIQTQGKLRNRPVENFASKRRFVRKFKESITQTLRDSIRCNKNLVFLINSSISRNHSVPKERFYYRKTIDSII
ncbi:hypothetical protein LEP1GSC005_0249 [Leptospira santarosai str. ST188]|uniref:Uncharacterized protein n=1 Tax=Leptospira santarosai str. ZUN179 TaxID=1049985 RepID=M6UF76_9LEPT|nr:hypothetical protein LEP1GSC005_0249 [Leptospira santarosai str. ST188]EMO43747.1 hypothetical protein LEP1GSC187_2489 [Leptospira santarosai str. ZUN179]EMO85554.1 hypothetical protein LEP1GSC070_3920 [Leptospira santarosai str. AIM]